MESSVVQTKKRISLELPEIIVDRLDSLARRMNFSRGELIRRFISEKVAEKEGQELEHSMKEGYLTNYDFIRESSAEWESGQVENCEEKGTIFPGYHEKDG